MAWHGTADSVLPYTMPQEEVDQWTNVHGLSQTPASTDRRADQGSRLRALPGLVLEAPAGQQTASPKG
jgi:hypothetical protein